MPWQSDVWTEPIITKCLQFLMPTMNPDGFAVNSRANAGEKEPWAVFLLHPCL